MLTIPPDKLSTQVPIYLPPIDPNKQKPTINEADLRVIEAIRYLYWTHGGVARIHDVDFFYNFAPQDIDVRPEWEKKRYPCYSRFNYPSPEDGNLWFEISSGIPTSFFSPRGRYHLLLFRGNQDNMSFFESFVKIFRPDFVFQNLNTQIRNPQAIDFFQSPLGSIDLVKINPNIDTLESDITDEVRSKRLII